MSKTIDMKGLIVHLTETTSNNWEEFTGRLEGIGEEQWFTEIGDSGQFGPYDEDVADMIREGYVCGLRWSLETDIDIGEDENAAHEIARLVSGGYTSGYDPVWSIKMEKIMPREAYVQIDDDFITVRIEATETHKALEFKSTIAELEANLDTAGFVTEEPMHKICDTCQPLCLRSHQTAITSACTSD